MGEEMAQARGEQPERSALEENESELKRLIEARVRMLSGNPEADASQTAAEVIRRIGREAERMRRTAARPQPVGSGVPAGTAVIIGGRGGMGRQLQRAFESSGWAVRIIGRGDWDRAREILEGASVVIVSVPIDATLKVIEDLRGLLPRDALLCDVTSVKTAPVEAMLSVHAGPVAGLHPMFGPDVEGFAGQVVVYAPGRDAAAAEPLLALMRSWGARVVTCPAEAHDRAMGIIQALRHFTTYAYGVFLSKIGADLPVILQLSSPIYRLELEMVGRLFAQDPRLYADIILASSRNVQLIRDYVAGLLPELGIIERRDRDAFIRSFERTRAYFGDLAPAFMKESGRMLNLFQAERAYAPDDGAEPAEKRRK